MQLESIIREQSNLRQEARAISEPFSVDRRRSLELNESYPADSTESSDEEDPYLRRRR